MLILLVTNKKDFTITHLKEPSVAYACSVRSWKRKTVG